MRLQDRAALGAHAPREPARLVQPRALPKQMHGDHVALQDLVAHVRVLQAQVVELGERRVRVKGNPVTRVRSAVAVTSAFGQPLFPRASQALAADWRS